MRDGMFLNPWSAWSLLILYIALLLVAGSLWWRSFVPPMIEHSEVELDRALLTSGTAAAVGSSLFYARKLYKDLFAMDVAGAKPLKLSHIATVAYFLLRPAFAVTIAAIITLGAYGFVHAVSKAPLALSTGFLIFVTLAGALSSAITGAAVQHVEAIAADTLKLIRPPG